MTPGTQFVYAPAHANGNTDHPDCLRGFVAGPQMGRSVMVFFWREIGVSVRTAYPQLTDVDRLVIADSCEQGLVDGLQGKERQP